MPGQGASDRFELTVAKPRRRLPRAKGGADHAGRVEPLPGSRAGAIAAPSGAFVRCPLAGGWACVGASHLLDGSRPTAALGTLLFAAVAGPLLAGLAALQTKLVPALVLLTTAVRWCLTAVFQVGGSHAWEHAAGYAGIVLAAVAVYGAASLELEDIRRRTVLPTLRRARGSEVMRNDLGLQVEKLASEAGVREQL